jgi:hypothetical protein
LVHKFSYSRLILQIVVVFSVVSSTVFAQCRVLDVDLAKGKPKDNRFSFKGGEWNKGWLVTGDTDQMVLDAGYDIKNGYFEVVVTRKGELTFAERKRNWMGLFACKQGNQCPGGYARAGDPMYEFSKAEIFSASQTHTICENKFGKFTDWINDGKTEHVVRAMVQNNIMTWSVKGVETSCGSKDQPVTHFRYGTVGGILDHKTGWHHGSLLGLRVLRVTIVDNDKKQNCKAANVKRK